MKIISIWQPFASLIVKGCKVFETRGWPAPASVIGTRIGIASTKSILPAQRSHCDDEEFKAFYARTGLDDWLDLPRGYLLGTVVIDDVEIMTEDFMGEVSVEEQSYGWWEPGGYAWRLADPIELKEPIPIRGMQGLFEWKGVLPNGEDAKQSDKRVSPDKEGGEAPDQGRSRSQSSKRRNLRVV